MPGHVSHGNRELHKCVQARKRERLLTGIDEYICECVQVDVDEWDSRYCPQHGPRSAAFRRQKEREAADLIAYYSGPDPSDEALAGPAVQSDRRFARDEAQDQKRYQP